MQEGILVEVTEGLEPNETVVTTGMNYLSDGAKVEIVKGEKK